MDIIVKWRIEQEIEARESALKVVPVAEIDEVERELSNLKLFLGVFDIFDVELYEVDMDKLIRSILVFKPSPRVDFSEILRVSAMHLEAEHFPLFC